jgi:N-formylglutamate deformylase
MERVGKQHGVAILYDCHSIRSHIPFLFEGVLPDFNIGTNDSATCAPAIEAAVTEMCARAPDYTSIVNGRFKGGWTTRHYGRPQQNWHAIQMELAQSTYLAQEAAPWTYDPAKAARLRAHLQTILTTLAALAPHLGSRT